MKSMLFLIALILLQVRLFNCSTVHPYYVGLQMGVGADSLTNQFFGVALQNFSINSEQYGEQLRWKFRSVSSSIELSEFLDVEIAGAFSNWGAHTSPIAQFAQNIAINKYNTYLFMQLVIEVSEENIVRPQLSEEAEYYVEQYGFAEFQNIYGRQYLGACITGGIFLGLITIHTLTSAEKQTMIKGLKFSGSGSALTPNISTEAQKILENRLVEVTTTQIFGQRQPIISTFDEMIDHLKQFPDLAAKYPVPIYGIFNEYKKSIAYPWHNAGAENDYQIQDDILYTLSTNAKNLKDRKSSLEYLQQYYDLFEEFQVGNDSDRIEFLEQKSDILQDISQEINQINIEIVKINRAAMSCVYNMDRCSVPTLTYKPVFELPEQQYGDVVLKAEIILEEMFIEAQKEINNSVSSAQEFYENMNLNATSQINNLIQQVQESSDNMTSQVQSNINNNNYDLEQAVSNATTQINDLVSQVQQSTENMNSEIQSNINNNNQNLEQAVSNATIKFNDLLSQAQESAENMNSQVQQNIVNNNQNLENIVSNATIKFNDLLAQAQQSTENMNSQVQSNINNNNQNLEYVISNATKKIKDMFSVNTAMIYYGDINNIPSGWQLCDGSNLNGVTIPDLRGRFPLGEIQDQGDSQNRVSYATQIGKIGGNYNKILTETELPTHTHTAQSINAHSHTFIDYYYAERNTRYCSYGSGNAYGDSGDNDNDNYFCGVDHQTDNSGDHTHVIDSAGQSQSFDIVPPFAVVYFICKIN